MKITTHQNFRAFGVLGLKEIPSYLISTSINEFNIIMGLDAIFIIFVIIAVFPKVSKRRVFNNFEISGATAIVLVAVLKKSGIPGAT